MANGWMYQGRQHHQWFGHGTKPRDQGVGTVAERIRALSGTVVASLPASKRSHRSATFDQVSRARLETAMTAWVASADLDAATFTQANFHASADARGIRDLQTAARLTRDAQTSDDVHRANDALAVGMLAIGLDAWPGFLARAAATAEGASAVQKAADRRAVPYYGPDSPFIPGSPTNQEAVRTAEEAARFLREKLRELMERTADQPSRPPALDQPLENRPPRDAKDKDGPKAPGKPGEAEGFEDPKTGEAWVKEPNGERRGWKHEDGSVWVPTGQGGRAHSEPHWDVQRPNGPYRNVYPGGFVRGSK